MIYVMFGSSGAGKTTQGKLLGKALGCRYISTGDIARGLEPENPQDRSPFLSEGTLSPKEAEIRQAVLEAIDGQERVVLDGFPRTTNQWDFLKTHCNINDFYGILLDVGEKVLVNRWVDRRRDQYDTLTISAKRHQTYLDETAQMVEAFFGADKAKGTHIYVHKEQPITEVHKLIMNAVQGREDAPSTLEREIDDFIYEHHIQSWGVNNGARQATTYSITEEDIKKKLMLIARIAQAELVQEGIFDETVQSSTFAFVSLPNRRDDQST